jgi:capsular polysaccharide biosynthesis protein
MPLDEYVRPLRTHRRVIALVALISLGFGILAAIAAPYDYTSTTTILINPISSDPATSLESTDRSADLATEVRLVLSRTVMEATSERLAGQSLLISPETLAERVQASSTRDSGVLDISYTASDPAVAKAGADAVAQSYLTFRTGLTEANKQSARDDVTARIAELQDQLAEVESRLLVTPETGAARVRVTVERSTGQGELSAQQAALADLSTLSAGGATVIDQGREPTSPDGLTGLQTALGAGAGGIVLGVVVAYMLAAYGSDPKPARRRRRRAAAEAAAADEPSPRTEPAAEATPAPRTEPAAEATPAAAATAGPETDPTPEAGSESGPAEVAAADDRAEPPPIEAADAGTVGPTTTSTPIDTPAPGSSPAPAPTPDPSRSPVSTLPEGEVEPAVATPAPAAPIPTDETAPATWDQDFSVSPATWATVAGPVPTGFAEMALAEAAESEPDPILATAASRGVTIPVAEPGGRVLIASDDFEPLLDQMRALGAAGPIATLGLSDGDTATALSVGLDLADELQSLGARVLVIEALVDGPLAELLFGDEPGPGLDQVLTGQVGLAAAVRTLPGLEGLDVLSAGSSPSLSDAALTGPSIERVLTEARTEYHAVVVIAGSAHDSTVVPFLATLVDGIIVGTTLPAGTPADAALVDRLVSLPAPTLALLSSAFDPEAHVAVEAAGM